VDEIDAKLAENTAQGQEVIDGLTSLRFLVHELDPSLHVQLLDLLPSIICALSSSYALIRSTAAKCLAAICDVVTEQGMKLLVDYVVPMVGDAKRVSSRQGAVEAIHRE
jgi:TATA-binding protein-associated factor